METSVQSQSLPGIGHWRGGSAVPAFDPEDLLEAIPRIREPVHVVREPNGGRIGVAFGGEPAAGALADSWQHLATLPPLYPEWLGDRSFAEVHRTRFPYVVGEMANGIASVAVVVAAAKAGCIGFFGAAGLSPDRVEASVVQIGKTLDPLGLPWGSNLIHSPNEPAVENEVAERYVRHGLRLVSCSAFMSLTSSVVYLAAKGLRADASGRIHRPRGLVAKLSRPEVAKAFLSPASDELLRALVSQGRLTAAEAALAARVPVAEDVTVEADSGGHTDNRPLGALFPTIALLRDEIAAKYRYDRPVRLGAAGGLGTPDGVAAAFALGASYVLTGSVNQACVESGLSEAGKAMLAQAGIADVVMAPAADMFELGVKVQILRRGTMYAARAQRLYELYVAHPSLEELPDDARQRLEREVFRRPLADVWADTRAFFEKRDPRELARAEADGHHRMALVFRWYLGKSSRWAIEGDAERRPDYQIWCGPAMGAFNAWTAGSVLGTPSERTIGQVALNLLEGAAVVTRAQQLRTYGVAVPTAAFRFVPRRLT